MKGNYKSKAGEPTGTVQTPEDNATRHKTSEKFLESEEYGKTTYQNLWGPETALSKGKFTGTCA